MAKRSTITKYTVTYTAICNTRKRHVSRAALICDSA